MRYTVTKDLLSEMEGLEPNKISVISTENYNNLLNNTIPSTVNENTVEVGIKLIIRSAKSNEVLVINDNKILDVPLTVPSKEGINGYFHVIHMIDLKLRELGKLDNNIMIKTHLITLGVYYDTEINKIYHVKNIVVLDDDIQGFTEMFSDQNTQWEKIVNIISSPSVSKFDKIVLSTLRIVK